MNRYFPIIAGMAKVNPYLLDVVPTARKAYSLRKLRSAYAGNANEVRRSLDDTAQQIGFSGINYDDAGFTAFLLGTNGFERSWYDQSGNALTALQATFANQLQVLLNYIGGRAGLLGAVNRDMAHTTQNLGTVQDHFVVFNCNNTNGMLAGGKASPENNVFYMDNTHLYTEAGGVFVGIDYAINKTTNFVLHYRRIGHESPSVSLNGTLIGYWNFLGSNPVLNVDKLLSYDPTANTAIKLAEDVVYTRGLTAAEVQLALLNIGAYYSIPMSVPYVTPYYLKRLSGNLTTITARDGMGMATNGTSEIIAAMGWVPGIPPFSKQDMYISANGGVSYTAITSFPGTERHWFGFGYKDSKYWILGGDHYNIVKDVWTLEYIAGVWTYTQLCSDWGNGVGDNGTLFLYSWCLHNNSWYLGGGQNAVGGSITNYNKVFKYNETTNVMDLVGSITGLTNFSTGSMISFNGNLYTLGGGKYDGASSILNTKIHVSTDNGATWAEHGTLPVGMRSMYPRATVLPTGRVHFLMGCDSGLNNVKGAWTSADLLTWDMEPSPTARHATDTCIYNGKMIHSCGNLYNDSWEFSQ